MGKALYSNNLSQAQQDWNAIQSAQTTSTTNAAGGQTSASSNSSPFAAKISADLSGLSSAFQSNSLTAAQNAFSQLQQDLSGNGQTNGSQSTGSHHHHHHHSEGGNPSSAPSSSTSSASSQASSDITATTTTTS
jgi:hypothetical protein